LSDSHPARRRLIFGLVAIFLVLAVFFVVCEVFLRSRHAADVQALTEKYEADRQLVFQKSDRPGRIYQYNPEHVTSNKHGYLGHDWEEEKAEGVYRIVVIGDSVAAGQGADWGQQYAWQLEEKLNAVAPSLLEHLGPTAATTSPDKRFEVLLLAVTGYSTVQELAVFEQDAYRYDPDLVIWSYVLNDPAHPVYHDASGELARYFYKPKSHLLDAMAKTAFGIREKRRIRARAPAGKEWEGNYSSIVEGQGLMPWNWHKLLAAVYEDEIQDEILQIRKISQAKAPNVPVIFAIHPIFHDIYDFDHYAFKKLTNELRKFARDKAKLIPVDLRYAYEGLNQDDVRIQTEKDPATNGYFDPWHINNLGHELVADFLTDFISKGLTDGWDSVRKGIPAPKAK